MVWQPSLPVNMSACWDLHSSSQKDLERFHLHSTVLCTSPSSAAGSTSGALNMSLGLECRSCTQSCGPTRAGRIHYLEGLNKYPKFVPTSTLLL